MKRKEKRKKKNEKKDKKKHGHTYTFTQSSVCSIEKDRKKKKIDDQHQHQTLYRYSQHTCTYIQYLCWQHRFLMSLLMTQYILECICWPVCGCSSSFCAQLALSINERKQKYNKEN